MKIKTIRVVDFYDEKKVIESFSEVFLNFEDDSYSKKKELHISNKTDVIQEYKHGIELVGIFSDFMQFVAFIPDLSKQNCFKKIKINCFYE